MERAPGSRNRGLAFTLAACAGLLLLAACGSRMIRDRSPFVQITTLRLDPQAVVLELGIRNVNDVPMDLAHVDFTLTVRDAELAVVDEPRQGSVIASGREALQFEFPGKAPGRALLLDLQAGKVPSLPYRLEGSILSADDHLFRFKGEGHLYPVPGRPGQFR
jgi:hypothetical protein